MTQAMPRKPLSHAVDAGRPAGVGFDGSCKGRDFSMFEDNRVQGLLMV